MAAGWYPGRCKDCAQSACDGRARCDTCRRRHNVHETARRHERRQKHQCTVCGARAVKVDGAWLTTCPTHREYYAVRARLPVPTCLGRSVRYARRR